MKRLMARGTRTQEEIAELFGISKGKLIKLLRASALNEILYQPGVLAKDEIEKLKDSKVKLNPFTRFFELAAVPSTVGLSYAADGSIEPTVSQTEFKRTMGSIARSFLFSVKGVTKPRFNTRSTPQDVFSALAKDHKANQVLRTRYDALAQAANKGAPISKGRATAIKVPGKFFESLKGLHLNDEVIDRIIDEIHRIKYMEFRTSAAFLARALLERTLETCIYLAGLKGDLRARAKGANVTLKELISFCETNHDRIFNQNVRRVLQQWQSVHKDYCDLLVHGQLFGVTSTTLETLAAETRPFILKALSREIVKVDA
jgi:hypothetical protein